MSIAAELIQVVVLEVGDRLAEGHEDNKTFHLPASALRL